MDTAYNNNVSGEREFGNSRPIFSDVGLVNLTGGFQVALTDVPAIADGYIPAGTPMQVDESTRTAKIFKVAKVATATGAAGAGHAFSQALRGRSEGGPKGPQHRREARGGGSNPCRGG